MGCLLLIVVPLRREPGRIDRHSPSQNIPYRDRFELLVLYPRINPLLIKLGVIAFLCSSIAMMIDIWIYWNVQNYDIPLLVLNIIITFCWSFGQFCSYLVFLLRLIDIFSNSRFAVSRNTIGILMALIIIYEIVWTIYCVAPFVVRLDFFMDMDIPNVDLFLCFGRFALIPMLILDALISIPMTFMFVSRLFMMIRSQTNIFRNHNLRMIALNQSLDDEESANRRLLDLSVKAAVLSITSLLSTVIWVDPIAVASFMNLSPSSVLWRMVSLWWQVATVISCLCLTLFMPKAKDLYNVLCCCCTLLGFHWMRDSLTSVVEAKASSMESVSRRAVREERM